MVQWYFPPLVFHGQSEKSFVTPISGFFDEQKRGRGVGHQRRENDPLPEWKGPDQGPML